MKVLYYVKRALTLPPHVLLRKIVHKVKKGCINKRKAYLDSCFPTYARESSFSSLKCYIKEIDISLLPTEKINELNVHFLKHEFNLLGSGWVPVIGLDVKGLNEMNVPESARISRLIQQPYSPIDWHSDFKSGYRWKEDAWSGKIHYGTITGVDVKVPWELSRMQHLVSLAWGYAATKQAQYLTEFQNQILDFISANPPRFGVNWACTMDVGIRIANWLLAYDLFCAFGAVISSEFQAVFIRSVYEHGHHIYNHLEWDPHLRSNHYLANIAGLLFVAAYLPPNPETDSWLQFSIKELKAEVMSQFNQDGSNFEASTSYHRLSVEMVLYATALAQEMKIVFPDDYYTRIQKMGDFIRDTTKPDGKIVQIGDNDSGRFIKMFPDSHMLDHRYLISPIRNLKDLTSVIETQLTLAKEKASKMSSYPDFGLFFHNTDPWFLAFRCGSIGQKGNGGHAHNDQLSFELAVNGISILVDPGTYVYTPFPNERRHFRSSAMHNTLAIEGREQNKDQGLFKMTDRAKAKVIRFENGIIVGEHSGFGVVHRRTVRIFDKQIEGIDECDENPKQIYFHLAPGVTGSLMHPKEVKCVYDSLIVRFTANQGRWTVVEGVYSDGYGKKESSKILVLNTSSKQTEWKIEISP